MYKIVWRPKKRFKRALLNPHYLLARKVSTTVATHYWYHILYTCIYTCIYTGKNWANYIQASTHRLEVLNFYILTCVSIVCMK